MQRKCRSLLRAFALAFQCIWWPLWWYSLYIWTYLSHMAGSDICKISPRFEVHFACVSHDLLNLHSTCTLVPAVWSFALLSNVTCKHSIASEGSCIQTYICVSIVPSSTRWEWLCCHGKFFKPFLRIPKQSSCNLNYAMTHGQLWHLRSHYNHMYSLLQISLEILCEV